MIFSKDSLAQNLKYLSWLRVHSKTNNIVCGFVNEHTHWIGKRIKPEKGTKSNAIENLDGLA